MLSIGSFLDKIKNKQTKEILFRSYVADIISKIIGVSISSANILYKNGVVTIKDVNSSIKSLIYIKKQAIIKEFELSKNSQKIIDIR